MRVGITGASGFIGREVARALRERGDVVVPFVRGARQDGAVRWTPNDRVHDEDLREPLDALIHLAGAGIADKRWSAARKQEILSSRRDGTATIASFVNSASTPPRIVLSGSAIGIYGTRGDETLTETSPHGSGFLAEVCEEWETPALGITRPDTRVSVLRTGIVMSPQGGALKKQLPLFKAGLGGRLGSGKQWMSPISLEDQVRAMLFVLDNDVTGPVNLVAPEPVTNAGFTSALAKALHRPALAPVPPVALSIALGSELVHEALLASQRVVPSVLEEHGFEFAHRNIEQIFEGIL
mgnify:CR=1 FL=1